MKGMMPISQMRIARIVHHLQKNQNELVAILIGRACLLNVSEEELIAIKQVFTSKKETIMELGVSKYGKND